MNSKSLFNQETGKISNNHAVPGFINDDENARKNTHFKHAKDGDEKALSRHTIFIHSVHY